CGQCSRAGAPSWSTDGPSRRACSRTRCSSNPRAVGRRRDVSRDTVVSFIGVPYDGAATLGWPGARYAPEDVRRQLAWMRMRVQDGHIYWVDEDRVIPWRPDQLRDAGDADVVPHDLMATLAAAREK